MKFFPYHWSLATGGMALAAGNAAESLRPLAGASRRRLAVPLVAAAQVFAFAQTGEPFSYWRTNTVLTARWLSGGITDEAFGRAPERAPYAPNYWEPRLVGEWVRDHSSPEDFILVRGAAAEIYEVSGRRAPGRFFWSVFLSCPTRSYRRSEWLAEDRDAIQRHPPRYVLVRAGTKTGPESASAFTSLGYEERQRIGTWIVLGREEDGAVPEARYP
jgi:hypothetical protein